MKESINDIIIVGELSQTYTRNILMRKTNKNRIREATNPSYSIPK